MSIPFFSVLKTSSSSKARLGNLFLKNVGISIPTPIFMPVATLGSIKSLIFEDLDEMGYNLILHNAYHLTLRPGLETIRHFENMKKLTGWKKGLLTDSGGFQIFSLEGLRKLTEEGVYFKDPIRGNTHFFSPTNIIDIQMLIGSDIIMPLDECTKPHISFEMAQSAANRTTRWAEISRKYISEKQNAPMLFGITQGNLFEDLRMKSIRELVDLDFPGYSIGGLSVGEDVQDMYKMVNLSTNHLPQNKPRYLMGVGLPHNLVEAVFLGIDMFDCVIPSRNARHGQAFSHTGKINFHNKEHRLSNAPLDEKCPCTTCKKYSRGYLHHLVRNKELTSFRLLTYHNLYYISYLMNSIRNSIENNRFEEFRTNFYESYKMEVPEY